MATTLDIVALVWNIAWNVLALVYAVFVFIDVMRNSKLNWVKLMIFLAAL